ncbi:hypothetical protein [Streptomyces sp. NPDC048269]|uniref:hypothetical protein n=1 Tax=Streptomyces sp. NPDC048269 TaxID=3155753 RepID=UPI00343D5121
MSDATAAAGETIYVAAGSQWSEPEVWQPYGKAKLAWQADGNLVVYCNTGHGRPVWASGTYGNLDPL